MASRPIEIGIDITWAVSRTDGLPFSTPDAEKVHKILKEMTDRVRTGEIEGFTIKSVGSEIKPAVLDKDAKSATMAAKTQGAGMPQIKIMPITTTDVELGKRFPILAVLETDCPKCGRPIRKDELTTDYPIPGRPFEIGLYCDNCMEEVVVKLVVELLYKLVD